MQMTKTDIMTQMVESQQAMLNSKARAGLLAFTVVTKSNFEPAPFHKTYYRILTDFAYGRVKKLMVFMPPQHGKSEGSTRRLPAFILGREPYKRIAVISYSAPKARKFNLEIQRVIDTLEYHDIFPDTMLGSSRVADSERGWLRNSEECEIVGHGGGFKTVGVGGALTGDPVDVLIMDDLYKDAKSAWSPVHRQDVSDWYAAVAETRLHNDSQQLMVFTRWHEHDLAGELLKKERVYDEVENPNGWVVVVFPAIKIGAPTELDPREEGQPLWPERHSLEKLMSARKKNPGVFESLYQQNPKPQEGLMYEGFRTYAVIPPSHRRIIKNYTDTADEGKDYLCSIDYIETEVGNYVLDILYTQRPMEYTEVKQAEMMTKDRVQLSIVESNNGGRGYARNVEKNLRLLGNNATTVRWFHQSENKLVRINTHSADVQNIVFYPDGWEHLWPDYYSAMTGYLKTGKNEHDDAPDATTGTVEQRPVGGGGKSGIRKMKDTWSS